MTRPEGPFTASPTKSAGTVVWIAAALLFWAAVGAWLASRWIA